MHVTHHQEIPSFLMLEKWLVDLVSKRSVLNSIRGTQLSMRQYRGLENSPGPQGPNPHNLLVCQDQLIPNTHF